MEENKGNAKVAAIIGFVFALLYLIAIADLPYWYYQLLRIGSIIGLPFYIYYCYLVFDTYKNVCFFVGAFVLILFNPIYPVYSNKETWVVLDAISSIALSVSNIIVLAKAYFSK